MNGNKIDVLDNGFVQLIDHMGDDSAIVQAARTSYGKGTKTIHDDTNLIRYLLRHNHTTPFEMVEFKFFIRMPMDIWRQHIRHRTASVNEYSTRYSVAINDKQRTASDKWRKQSETNKQGSNGYVDNLEVVNMFGIAEYNSPGEYLSKEESIFHEMAQQVYENRLNSGVAKEQARKDLPLSTYTEAYWKIDLHNLFNYIRLRIDSHAQEEIQKYADAMSKLIRPIIPAAWDAFVAYRLNSMNLTQYDIAMMITMNTAKVTFEEALKQAAVPESWHKPKCRERDECLEKMQKLSFIC